MRLHKLAIGTVLLLSLTAFVLPQSGANLYQQARGKQDIGDYAGAIKIYERILNDSLKDRSLVANTKLHLAESWLKLDKTKGANLLNEVINSYKNDKELGDVVAEARRLVLRIGLPPKWTQQDSLLIAQFDNQTGNPLFDGYLDVFLSLQLTQSPYLNVISSDRMRESLARLGHSRDEKVTHAIARDICSNAGAKAMLLPSIMGTEGHYTMQLMVQSCSGDKLLSIPAEAISTEKMLAQLPKIASQLRSNLGESDESIRRFDGLRTITTNSPEAYLAYQEGYQRRMEGDLQHAMDALNRATKLDPNFALAYALSATLGVTNKTDRIKAADAYRLRDRVSEKERGFIDAVYQSVVLGNLDKTISTLEQLKGLDPRDGAVRLLLGDQYRATGRFEEALKELGEAVRLQPASASARESLFRNYMELNDLTNSKRVFKEAEDSKANTTYGLHTGRYVLGFFEGDKKAMSEQINWVNFQFVGYKIPMAYVRAQALAFGGELANSQKAWDEYIKNTAGDSKAYRFLTDGRTKTLYGDVAGGRALVERGMQAMHGPRNTGMALQIYGLEGDEESMKPLIRELAETYPEDTIIHRVLIPTGKAALELTKGNGAEAIRELEAARPYGACLYCLPAIYLRGLAYLQTKSNDAAILEFQNILNHRGIDPVSAFYPLAKLRLAQAYAQNKNIPEARKSYEEFLDLWKNADPDVPVLKQARAEFAALAEN